MGNNYVNDFDLLEEVAKISGTTGKQAYESGTIGEIIKNAEQYGGGKLKNWKWLKDETGRDFAAITKNGKFLTSSSGGTNITKWQGANQMGTEIVTTTTPTKTVEVLSGDVLNAEGQVIKRGLVPGAVKGANFLTGGMAVLGGIATGVQWYKDNPELWTDLGLKCFQWLYDDPYDKSWSDILYDALVPTAVDSAGTTYLNSRLLQQLADGLIDMGFYDVSETAQFIQILYDNVLYKNNPDEYKPLSGMIIYELPKGQKWEYYNSIGVEQYGRKVEIEIINSTKPVYCFIWTNTLATGNPLSVQFVSEAPFSGLDWYTAWEGTVQSYTLLTTTTIYGKNKEYPFTSATNRTSIKNLPVALLIKYNYWEKGPSPDNKNFTTDIQFLVAYSNKAQSSEVINTELQPDAKYPEKGVPLATTFPEWDAKAVETVNPDSTPENPTYDKWYPVNLPDTSSGEEGKTAPDVKQKEAQEGKVTEEDKKKIMDIIQEAISNTVIPWNPSLPSDPDGTVPEKPQPNPPEPTVPALGGTANGLWQMYNPTKAELQFFGKWLWSQDALEIIKRIFANSPMDAIIGLHAIFATPITEGRSSIVCGYLDSGVQANLVKEQYTTIDCGTVYVPPYYNNVLDYGSTTAEIYLPFIGIQELSIYDIMEKYVNVTYTIDVLTGTILAQITVSLDNYSAVLYSFNGSCSIEYPLTSGSRAQQVLSAITGAVAGATKLSVPAMAVGAVAGAARGATVQRSGTLSANAGAMGIRKPYIIIKHPVGYEALDYNKLYGYPLNTTEILNKFKGYTRVKDVHVDTINATDEEKRMIETLLKSGVIIS